MASNDRPWFAVAILAVTVAVLFVAHYEMNEPHLNKMSNDAIAVVAGLVIAVSAVVVASFFVTTLYNFARSESLKREEDSKIAEARRTIEEIDRRIRELTGETKKMKSADELKAEILSEVDSRLALRIGIMDPNEDVLHYIRTKYATKDELVNDVGMRLKAELYAELASVIFRNPLPSLPPV